MAKAIKKVKEAAAKLAKIRKKPGMSNAGKYPNVKESNFCGPNGTYPVNTIKRARSALSLAHFSADPGDIRKCVHKKYPQLAADEKKEAKKIFIKYIKLNPEDEKLIELKNILNEI